MEYKMELKSNGLMIAICTADTLVVLYYLLLGFTGRYDYGVVGQEGFAMHSGDGIELLVWLKKQTMEVENV